METSEGALKVAIHRLRKKYRELFRQQIADTVADPAEGESELRFLASALTGIGKNEQGWTSHVQDRPIRG